MNFQRIFAFSKKNLIELLTDKIAIFMTILFPFIFLIFFLIIGVLRIPETNHLEYFYRTLTISTLFAYVLLCLYIVSAISKEKKTGLLKRIAISPIKPVEIIIGYSIPYIILGYFEFLFLSIITFCFGMNFNVSFLLNFIILIPILLFFISFAILFGSLVNEKMAGVVGIIVTGGIFIFTPYFLDISINSVDAMSIISYILPFANIYDSIFKSITSEFNFIIVNIFITIIYSCLFVWGSGAVLKLVLRKK
ncbi:ABC transporter permease [Spiroplasma taiwanense]|uniref:ABC-2 type transporter transmembrane domain-containing protein n=1 Tax=Spiroplasma taiwanense CT-1 TaxID=1276220 RepID=S5LU10_9MOLU|nr:ABC transporter permease [Spiroplasma taiwanense]AGR41209.1 hypothetical protein STAIW_v1c05870 [Spiroplasma taiwanense CT-1]